MVGGAGTLITAGVLEDLDPNPEVRGRNWYGEPGKKGIGEKMMIDPHVRQSVEYVIAPLIAGTWRFRPASDAPIDREIAAFNNYAWLECMPWKRIIRSIVRGYVRDGFYMPELTEDFRTISKDRFPNHPGDGRAVIPTGLHERPAWSITRFNPSKSNPAQLASVEQWLRGGDAEKSGRREIPADRLLRFTWDQDGANFAGMPILRSAFQPWKIKMILLTIDSIKHDRMGVGLPVVTLGEDADEADVRAAELLGGELRANEKGYAVLTDGDKLEWLEGGKGGSELDLAISRCNIDIAMNVAAGFMLLSLQQGPGSQALAGTQQGQHHLGIVGHGEFATSVFNFGSDGWSPVERITRLNYGPDVAVPMLEVRHLPTRNWLDVVKSVYDGARSSVIRLDEETETEVRAILQLNPFNPATARETKLSLVQPQKANDSGAAEKSDGPPDDITQEANQ